MPILPDRILSPAQVSYFITQCNECQKRLTGQALFQIPDPELPGVGLLIDLQIQVLERSIASAFAPIFLGKKIITDAKESPARFLSIVKNGVESIKDLFNNPLQFVLDEGVNKVLVNFPFPIRLVIDSSVSGINTSELRDLLNNVSVLTGQEGLSFNYDIEFNSSKIPSNGEITTSAANLNQINTIRISNSSKIEQPPLSDLEPGDFFTLFTPEDIVTYRISSKIDKNTFFDFGVQVISSSSNVNQNNNKIFSPGFSRGLTVSQDVSLRKFLIPNGSILLPFSIFGLNFIGFDNLAVEIGNFTTLPENSKIKERVNKLEIESGLNFQTTLSEMIDGVFPKIDQDKLQNGDTKEKSKEKLIGISRLIQLGVSKPLFVIKIILSYLKLLLLPLKIVFGVLKGLAQKITNPVSLIRTVVRGISNPLKLICELISIAVLEFLDPYLRPTVTPILPYDEAVVDPNNSSKGFKPLISDLICGNFFKKLKNYTPNSSFFQEQNRLLSEDNQNGFGPNLPYFIVINSENPQQGEIAVNTDNPNNVGVLKISTTTNTVEDSTSFLANVNNGETVRLVIENSVATFRVNSSFFRISNSGNYYEFLVQPILIREDPNTGQSNLGITQNTKIPIQGLSSLLNINNPNKEFLFIIEEYLPVKLISAWQSIKGILALVICIVARIPSLLTAVVKSLFNRGQDVPINDEETEPQNPVDLVESTQQIIEILYNGNDSVLNKINDTNLSDRQEFLDIAIGIIGNIPGNADGIEQPYYNIRQNLSESGKPFQVFNSRLPQGLPVNFYWGALDVNDLGNIVKILSVAYFELRNLPIISNGKPWIATRQPIPKVFANVSGESVEIFSGGELIDVLNKYRIFTDLVVIINGEVTTAGARSLINAQLLFVSRYLLPSLI